MMCSNGKTVELLYRIKNECGSEMKWMLVMLGTWHLLKDYLHIFLKKYEHVVARHLFSKFLTKSNVDTLINCTKWWKSHNYTIWLISVVLRENVPQFLSYLRADVSHDLFKKAEAVADSLRRDSIDQDSIKEFIYDLVELRSKFEKFAVFTNMFKGLHAHYAMFIAIRTGNWSLKIASLKMMTTRFLRSGAHTYK